MMIIINQKVAIALSLCVVAVFTSSCNNIFLFYPNYDGNKNSIAYAQQSSSRNGQVVTFITDDGVSIVGTYYAPSSGLKDSTPTIILLHMLGKDRSTWNTFASALSHKGYDVLAIDLRGHGDSIKQGSSTASYQSFTENDFNKMTLDVKAAKQFLIEQKNAKPDRMAVIGASIGANIALNYAATLDPTIKIVILLSPGLNYRGVAMSDTITKYKNPIYIAATEGDSESAKDSQTLCTKINCGENLKIYSGSSSHGTNMFSEALNPPLQDLIMSWLSSSLPPM
jgi:pimeloyl-ACP methyl ester carboxylesterase